MPTRRCGAPLEARSNRWLVGPDSFKGTLSAWAVATALSDGLTSNRQLVDCCPLADGGEGTMRALVSSLGGSVVGAPARDPLEREIQAALALLSDGRTAVVETTSASGLHRVSEHERDAETASSAGTGDLIVTAARAGAARILLAVGGSATTDGGVGAVEAIRAGGGLEGVELEVLCDTDTPFESAGEVFGPQKGATPDAVRRLTARLTQVAQQMPKDPRGVRMGGCAGGLSGAMWACFDARLRSGAEAVLDAVDFDSRARAAGNVITGEGRLDRQSLHGKLVGAVVRRAAAAGAKTHAVVGQNALDGVLESRLGLTSVLEASTLTEIFEAGCRLGSGIS
jgi:glycerate kinase